METGEKRSVERKMEGGGDNVNTRSRNVWPISNYTLSCLSLTPATIFLVLRGTPVLTIRMRIVEVLVVGEEEKKLQAAIK